MDHFSSYPSPSSFYRSSTPQFPKLVYENLGGYVEQNEDGSYTSYDCMTNTSNTWTPYKATSFETKDGKE